MKKYALNAFVFFAFGCALFVVSLLLCEYRLKDFDKCVETKATVIDKYDIQNGNGYVYGDVRFILNNTEYTIYEVSQVDGEVGDVITVYVDPDDASTIFTDYEIYENKRTVKLCALIPIALAVLSVLITAVDNKLNSSN